MYGLYFLGFLVEYGCILVYDKGNMNLFEWIYVYVYRLVINIIVYWYLMWVMRFMVGLVVVSFICF